MQGLLPFFIYYISVAIIVYIEPQFVGFAFIISIGLTMAYVVGRIIVHHLAKQDFPMFNFPTLLPMVQLIIYLILVKGLNHNTTDTVKALCWMGFGVSLGTHGFFMNEIIYEFTSFLDVYALTIKHPKHT